MMKYVTVTSKIIKLLEENIGVNLYKFDFYRAFIAKHTQNNNKQHKHRIN